MQYGYQCEDCETSVFPTAPRSELSWLRDRLHVAREAAKHTTVDTWLHEGLEFLIEHSDHSVILVSRRR